jgi:hypothetical protein
MKVEFIKDRLYKGKQYKIGDIVDMTLNDFKIYNNFKAVKKYFTPVKKKTDLENIQSGNYNFRVLQGMCKQYGLNAAGSTKELKDRLVSYLTEKATKKAGTKKVSSK